MTTLVAALIAAAAALAVMVIDRAWSAREQRRDERRRIYAQFLGACWEGTIGEVPVDERSLRRVAAWSALVAEVALVAPRDVDKAAMNLARFVARGEREAMAEAIQELVGEPTLSDRRPGEEFADLYVAFVEAARRDVGVRR